MYCTEPVTMRPNSTIEAMIRHYNRYDLNKEELQQLVEQFNQLNPDAKPPRPYQQVKIPLLVEPVELSKTTTHKYRTGE